MCVLVPPLQVTVSSRQLVWNDWKISGNDWPTILNPSFLNHKSIVYKQVNAVHHWFDDKMCSDTFWLIDVTGRDVPQNLLPELMKKIFSIWPLKPTAGHSQRSLSGVPLWPLSSGKPLIQDARNCLLVRTFTWASKEERSHSVVEGVGSTGSSMEQLCWKYRLLAFVSTSCLA